MPNTAVGLMRAVRRLGALSVQRISRLIKQQQRERGTDYGRKPIDSRFTSSGVYGLSDYLAATVNGIGTLELDSRGQILRQLVEVLHISAADP